MLVSITVFVNPTYTGETVYLLCIFFTILPVVRVCSGSQYPEAILSSAFRRRIRIPINSVGSLVLKCVHGSLLLERVYKRSHRNVPLDHIYNMNNSSIILDIFFMI